MSIIKGPWVQASHQSCKARFSELSAITEEWGECYLDWVSPMEGVISFEKSKITIGVGNDFMHKPWSIWGKSVLYNAESYEDLINTIKKFPLFWIIEEFKR